MIITNSRVSSQPTSKLGVESGHFLASNCKDRNHHIDPQGSSSEVSVPPIFSQMAAECPELNDHFNGNIFIQSGAPK